MNPGKVEWNEENKPQPDMELLEQWISRQENQMREDIAALIRIPSIADQQEAIPGAPYGKKMQGSTGTDASIWIERTDGDRRYRRTLSDYCYRQREC